MVKWEMRWPRGLCARLRIERFGFEFESWPGTLCYVLGQDTKSLFAQMYKWVPAKLMLGGKPAMD